MSLFCVIKWYKYFLWLWYAKCRNVRHKVLHGIRALNECAQFGFMLFFPSKRCKCVHNQVALKREKLSGGLKSSADEKTCTGGAGSLPPLRFLPKPTSSVRDAGKNLSAGVPQAYICVTVRREADYR